MQPGVGAGRETPTDAGGTRPYRSPIREEAARVTRARIRDAAAALFVEHGYVGTTVRHVAERAGVAGRTVFTVFPGGKSELFHAAYDEALARSGARQETDVRLDTVATTGVDRILDEMTGYSVDLLERAGALMLVAIESAGADEEMREFARQAAADTAANAMTLAEGLAAHALLRPEISVQHAADVLFTVVSPQVHALLRRECGWDVETYRSWVTRTLRASLA
ncbi:TetR/AcrR family transcriptional regulator [Rhodococcus triatomae]|uniref:DNA-binding transcriptional regulator, AcrR family n=1 Tax=Rhodococcus triatomae TaxID=300028 RepID=A0A1G8CY31_9NOCA|nr:TetR/AcrR family transcriptional regulator [Rhodococcus triatomae]QNG18552.1 TetR/AcrR family transcriptional regulator [Rhodococcus triatomae]QNG21779.1 TetR/AcrR family transcriptional regulator [Rhodococcus triatomae]SDH50418.1 DNA-binding transcriptional regulator, AcrR family [Rhodococcus triatomae]